MIDTPQKSEKMIDISQKSEALYKDFLNGNENAFNEIIKIYRKQLINFIYGYVHNLDIAEDLAQDTFLYVLVKKNEYDFKYTLKTYLYTVAKCRAINYVKRSGKKVEFLEEYANNSEEIDFEENIIRDKNIQIVRETIKKLKPQYQNILYLRDFQYFEYKEICKILNINMYQTKMLIYRARKSLKKILEGEGYKYEK